MSSIHYDPKLDRRLKKEAAKNAIKKVKDAVVSTTKGDFKKAKKDIKEAGEELAKGIVLY